MGKYFTYVLQSQSKLRYYIGSCSDIEQRLARHNRAAVRATKYGVPWKLIYVEEYDTRQQAYRREREIKSYKGGEAFKKLLKLS